jgi:hypothetical protein
MFISKILHRTAPIPLKTPHPGTLHSPDPILLLTPMDRYLRDHGCSFIVSGWSGKDHGSLR